MTRLDRLFGTIALAAAVGLAGVSFAEPETESPTEAGTPTASDDDGGAGAREPDAPDGSAEPPPAPKARRGIEEIVVQAGESESATDFEAGDSVAAFDASDLEALGAQSIEDLAAFTPNLEIVTAGATTPTFFIRGVGLNDFAANSSGAVAVYQNDVALNSPALQLSTLFDVEGVNILRGPQGTGPFRNASAGAIKVYSRKPSGGFGGYFTTSYGNYNAMDHEGAVEAPIYEDILSARFAFRYTDREGYATNGCGNALPFDERGFTPSPVGVVNNFDANGDPLSLCGERVQRILNPFSLNPNPSGKSQVPEGLPEKLNNTHNWAGRGTILFQPTLDMEWLLVAQGGRRNEQSRLGQAYGTGGSSFNPDCLAALPEDVLNNPAPGFSLEPCRQLGTLGGIDSASYQTIEVKERLDELDPCREINMQGRLTDIPGACGVGEARLAKANAEAQVASELAKDLDSDPHRVDVNRVGPTINDTWGVMLKGDVVLGEAVSMRSVTGYNTYDRFVSLDLDFTPNTLFEFETTDTGWQVTQDLSFSGYISEDYPLRWEVGGFFLQEQLDVFVDNFFDPNTVVFGVDAREYTQDLLSLAGYLSLEWDFWEDFTLDGGFRYNWEQKDIDYLLIRPRTSTISPVPDPIPDYQTRVWQAPTGTARLTYRFREDTHAFFKYTRGWKGGHYNATGSQRLLVTAAEPETIDAFEAGLRGSWFGGMLNAQFSTFYYDYSNYQIFTAQQVLGSPPEFVVLNASSAEVYGAELDLVARPLPGLYLQARLSWLESQFLDFVQTNQETFNGDVIVKEVQNTGNPLLNSPNYKVSLTAEQTIPLGRWGTVTARWDGAWTDDTNYDASGGLGTPNAFNEQFLPENSIGQRAYWLHNVRLAYRTPSGALEISGWCRNVADQVYKTFAFDGSAFQQTTIYFVGEPRTYGGTVTVTF